MLWDAGIDVSIRSDDVTGNVKTVIEILPWLQEAIAKHYPNSKYNVERMGGEFRPTWVEPPEYREQVKRPN